MTIHVTSGIRFAIYYRKSNKHNWILGLTAPTSKELARCIYLNQKDFRGYQHGYIKLNPMQSYQLDDLPKNADVKLIRINLFDPKMVIVLDNLYLRGIKPSNKMICHELIQHDLISEDELNSMLDED